MIYLWLDDERSVPKYFNNGIVKVATNVDDAISIICNEVKNDSIFISFDHDLGTDKTGYDFAKWLIEHNYTGYFHIHTMNPVGAANIRQLLAHYGWTEKFHCYYGWIN